MRIEDLDYELPPEQIAVRPLETRDASRLLVYKKSDHSVEHRQFSELSALLRPGDLLVLNNTRVIPARLFNTRSTGGKIEILLLKQDPKALLRWTCLIRPGKKVRDGLELAWDDGVLATVNRTADPMEFSITFKGLDPSTFRTWLQKHGEPPIPPYLERPAEKADWERYQTVFAENEGSVAAPTAGLHFTPNLLQRLEQQGVQKAFVTLSVGYGTFSPLSSEQLKSGVLHSESYEVSPETLAKLGETRRQGGRVIAVGTTSLRALESLAVYGSQGSTQLFIRPGFVFKQVDGLITNFHLPRSSLLALVASLIGTEEMHRCYRLAIQEGYRFYSYGDAMVILPG